MPEAVRTTTSQAGAAARRRGSAASPSRPGIERSSSTRSGWSSCASCERLGSVRGLSDHVEAALREQGCERVARQRVVVDDENSFGHLPSHRQTAPCRLGGRAAAMSKTRSSRGSSVSCCSSPCWGRRRRSSSPIRSCGARTSCRKGGSCSTPPSCSQRRSSRSSPASASPSKGGALDLLLAAGFFVAGRRDARVLGRSRARRLQPGRAGGLGGDRLPRARGDADRAGAARARAADRRAAAGAPRRDRAAARGARRDLAAAARLRRQAQPARRGGWRRARSS